MKDSVNKIKSDHKQKIRLLVFRSNRNIYAGLFDEKAGKTIISVSSKKIDKNIKPLEKAKELGEIMADKAKKLKINSIVFDRRKYKYHGQVKALAEGMREKGIKF